MQGNLFKRSKEGKTHFVKKKKMILSYSWLFLNEKEKRRQNGRRKL